MSLSEKITFLLRDGFPYQHFLDPPKSTLNEYMGKKPDTLAVLKIIIIIQTG